MLDIVFCIPTAHNDILYFDLYFKSAHTENYVYCNLESCFIYLNSMTDCLSFRQDFTQTPSTQNITKSCLGQQSSGIACVLHICDRHGSIVDLVINYSINSHSYTVFG